ncbi:MAG TPA: tetratricopeptide repeat protein [Vitreimonas sp.]|nr:tetratricopeptide repeat protein [Vitreimonas sp.]
MAVGYLFTDIEGSTERWEASPGRMAAAVARHDEILDACITEYGGVIQDRAGDGVFALFVDGNAVACALAIQRRVSAESWADVDGLKVRIGVHAAEPVGMGLVDRTAVNRAARIVASGWGGQTVVSEAAATTYALPDGAQLSDLGICYLKGIPEALRLFGLVHPDLAENDFPPLRSQFRSAGTVPLQAAPLFGRAGDIAAISQALTQTRLLTVVGPGGNGKTRLAVELAKQWEIREPVLFLSLRGVAGATELVSAIGEALRFPFRDRASREEQLSEYLRDKRTLLILDNAEGIAGKAGFLASLVASCPDLAILATSREPLHVQGEGLYRLGGISADASKGDGLSPAYQVFVHAARSRQPEFDLTEAQLPSFQELCQCVGGSPLALRLMAQWVSYLSLEEILSRVKVDFDFLAGGGAEEQHHQTIREVFEESWRRLDERHRTTLASLSIMEGSFDWSIAHDALGAPLDAFAALEQKGLIDPTFGRRFSIHPLIRTYAREKFTQMREIAAEVVLRHRAYFLGLVRNRMKAMPKLGQTRVVEELQTEIADIRAAWFGALQDGDEDTIALTVEPLCYFLNLASLLRDGVALFCDPDGLSAPMTLHLRSARANFLVQQGELEQARALGQKVLGDENAPPLALAHAHMAIGNVAHTRGDFVLASECYEVTRRIRETLDDPIGLAFVTISLGALYVMFKQPERARDHIRNAFRISRQNGLTLVQIVAHMCAGDIALSEGRLEDARSNFARGLDLDPASTNPQYRAQLLRRAGSLALRMGNRDDAERHHTEALELFLDLGDQRAQAQAYIDLGEDSLAAGRFAEARERLMRGLRLAIAFASAHLRNTALLGLARAEIGLGNTENAGRIARILADTDVARDEAAYREMVAALGPGEIEGPPCALDDVLSEIANDADARALML